MLSKRKIPLISSIACFTCSCIICANAAAAPAEEKGKGRKDPPQTIEEGTSATGVYDTQENVPNQTLPSQFYWDTYPYKTPPASKPNTTPPSTKTPIFNDHVTPNELPPSDTLSPENYLNTSPTNNYYDQYWRKEENEPDYKISPNNFNPTFFDRESDHDRWERERQEREQDAKEQDEQRRREEDQRRQIQMQQHHGAEG